MTRPSPRTWLATLAALGGMATAASAQLPPAPATPQPPQVIRWPGGYMVMNGPEVIVRSTTPGLGSTNLITGSGNGVGNKIVVSGGAGGVTIVSGVRNGIGNQLMLDANDWLIDLDVLLGVKPACPKPVVPPAPVIPPPPAVVPPG